MTRNAIDDIAKKLAFQIEQMSMAAKNTALCSNPTNYDILR